MGRGHGHLPCLDPSRVSKAKCLPYTLVSLSPSLSLPLLSLPLCSSQNPKNELGRDLKSPPHGSSPRARVGCISSAKSHSLATREESAQDHRSRPRLPHFFSGPVVLREEIRPLCASPAPAKLVHAFWVSSCTLPCPPLPLSFRGSSVRSSPWLPSFALVAGVDFVDPGKRRRPCCVRGVKVNPCVCLIRRGACGVARDCSPESSPVSACVCPASP